MIRPGLRFLFSHPAHLLALGFGAGLSPKAPGTLGTLVAFPLYLLLTFLPVPGYWGCIALALAVGIPACERAGRDLGEHDHGGIVWDEIAAFLLVLPWAPQSWWGFALAFGLFRLFDIWKPFPIAWFDARVGGGLGVMLDDLLAAAYAVAVLIGVKAWM